MPNALARETSPYLLQHRDNPVDWLPWGPEALGRARAEDRPLLVSIGYSSCHWCHVMERECFEDPEVAALMNRWFVCVKVDREERPEVDALYMEAVQAMTGSGGWPLHVFLTPDQVPFYGGTYFPPRPARGLPSWPQVLEALADAWATQREEIREQGARMQQRLGMTAALRPSPDPITADVLEQARGALALQADAAHGGYGDAPKFPPSGVLTWLLEHDADPHALATLRAMAAGGIHDQVGGGFARYAVDASWTVPHFEKMLYDNALLLRAYALGAQRTGDAGLARVAAGIAGFLQRDMAAPDGGLVAALDADTGGVEGATYTWTVEELEAVLGADAPAALRWLRATAEGDVTGPHVPRPGPDVLTARGPEPDAATRERVLDALRAARATRPQPGVDDKRLTSWNALAAGALAAAGDALREPSWVAFAEEVADFVLRELRGPDGRLRRTYGHGVAKLDGLLDDHAHLLEALLDLFEATGRTRWYAEAVTTAQALVDRFADPEHGGFFQTPADGEPLLVRRRDLEDAPLPSGSASAALGLLRLGALSGDARWTEAGVSHLRLVHKLAARHPQAFAHTLRAIAFHLGPVREVAVVGPGREALLDVLREVPRPLLVRAAADGPDDAVPLLAGREPRDDLATAFVCEGFVCRTPVTDAGALRELLA